MLGQKVNIYFDGFNFYNGLKDNNWEKYYWLDIVKLSEKLIHKLNPNHSLINAYYFSAVPDKHKSKERRQKKFFDVNSLNPRFKLIKGYHRDKSKTCNKCNYKIAMSEEKQTDVNIALTMLKNAVKNNCELSILVSGDTDMIPIIESIKEIDPQHMIMLFFPPKRKTHQMIQYVDGWRSLDKYSILFKECIFSDTYSGITIPVKWKSYQ